MMAFIEIEPKALFGDPLEGHAPLRFVYLDEAGTSAKEPVTVVAGIIVDADSQWLPASQKMREVLTLVPERLRSGFLFHAKDVWSNRAYREFWSFEDRLALLKRVVSIPRELDLPICYGFARRDFERDRRWGKLSNEQRDHMVSFAFCAVAADGYMRGYGRPGELATIIAEDVPKIRTELNAAIDFYRDNPRVLKNGRPPYEALSISRIIDQVHFVGKRNGPLLQIADACCFVLRRVLSGQSFGLELARVMDPDGVDWSQDQGWSGAGVLPEPDKCNDE